MLSWKRYLPEVTWKTYRGQQEIHEEILRVDIGIFIGQQIHDDDTVSLKGVKLKAYISKHKNFNQFEKNVWTKIPPVYSAYDELYIRVLR